jgi:hypothetical protein
VRASVNEKQRCNIIDSVPETIAGIQHAALRRPMDMIKRIVMTCNQLPFDYRYKIWITHTAAILDVDKDAKRMKGVGQ